MSYYCSLCDDTLLRHIRQSGLYWFCPSCRQEMPKVDLQCKVSSPDTLPKAIELNQTYSCATLEMLA